MTRSGRLRSKTDLLQSFCCQGVFMNGDSLIRMRLSMTTQIWRDSKGRSFTSDFTAYDPDQLSIITVTISFKPNVRLKYFVWREKFFQSWSWNYLPFLDTGEQSLGWMIPLNDKIWKTFAAHITFHKYMQNPWKMYTCEVFWWSILTLSTWITSLLTILRSEYIDSKYRDKAQRHEDTTKWEICPHVRTGYGRERKLIRSQVPFFNPYKWIPLLRCRAGVSFFLWRFMD